MNWDTHARALYALCIWREARGEGELGMRAVGHVIWNRHRGGRSLIRVITDDAQFTSINPPGKTYDPQLDEWPKPPDPRFELAMKLVDEIMAGKSKDPTHGATFYRNPKTATSQWYERHVVQSSNYRRSAVIGNHEFHAPIKL